MKSQPSLVIACVPTFCMALETLSSLDQWAEAYHPGLILCATVLQAFMKEGLDLEHHLIDGACFGICSSVN